MTVPPCRRTAHRTQISTPSTGRRRKILAELGAEIKESVPLGRILAAFGSRTHALAMLVLALPESLPLPIPSAGLVLGIPLIVIAGHLALFGEESPMPAVIRDREVPAAFVSNLAKYGVPALQALERISEPRFRFLAAQTRLAGIFGTWASVILFLPIPFVNIAPAACILLIALGLIRRDGLVIGLGMLMTLLMTLGLVLAAGSLALTLRWLLAPLGL